MSTLRNWSLPEDADLILLRRSERKNWLEIAAEFGCTRQALAQFAKRNGLWTDPLPSLKHIDAIDPNRMPLPPGHEISWGAITWGTLLHGAKYTT